VATLQEQARALGDPTRYAIFRYVADAGGPVDIAEMTAHFRLHHNAIRQHLAKLVEAGLVAEDTAPRVGRGRPRLVYRVDPGAESRWDVVGPYERLSRWLAEIVRTGDTAVEVGRRVGRRDRDRHTDRDAVGVLVHEMARNGFDPAVQRRGDSIDIAVRRGPFAATAVADPDTVCALHLGIAYGVAEDVPGLEIDELVAKDPRRAHCHLKCRVEAGA
jgi:predicted ArsR family transcriptional regulator